MITIDDPELLTEIPDNLTLYSGIVRDITIGLAFEAIAVLSSSQFFTQETIYYLEGNTIDLTSDYPYQVLINGNTYTLALDPLNPSQNEFIVSNNQIILPVAEYGIATVTYIESVQSTTAIATNYILPPYPEFIREWNCLGSLNISKSFQDHPSISANFNTTASEFTIKTTLKKGSIHRFYGMDYEVTNLAITRLSADKLGNIYQRRVEVSFQGIWYNKPNRRNPLDEPIYLRGFTINKQTRLLSLASLCNKVNVKYFGDRIYIKVDSIIDPEATIEIRSEFEDRAIINNDYIYYSNPNGIQAKSYPSKVINLLGYSDLKVKELKLDLPGTGAFYSDLQLVREYRNTELQLNLDEDSDANTNSTYSLYTFENARDLADVFSPMEYELKGSVFYIVNNELKFQDNSFNWDSGGLTKAYTLTTYYNGQPIKIEYEKYGFVYTSLDCYGFRKRPIEDVWVAHYITPSFYVLWRVVEQWTETVITDKNGYITDRIKSGFRYHRYQQETEDLECVRLYIDYLESTDGDEQINLLQQIDSYKGFKVPFTESTGHLLDRFDNYYQDMISSNCSEDEWYPKKFCYLTETSENTILTKANPAHKTDNKQPPELSAGKKFLSRNEVKIILPRTIASKPKTEKFEQIDYNINSEGERFKHSLKISTVTQNEGRPSEHERVETFIESGSDTVINDNIKYILNTSNSGVSSSDPIQDSISFTDVDDKAIALKAAETQLSIDNLDAETVEFNLNNRKNWNEGDLILFDNKYYVIMGITDEQQIINGKLLSANYSINAGRLLKPNVTITERIIDDECATN